MDMKLGLTKFPLRQIVQAGKKKNEGRLFLKPNLDI